MMLVLPYPLRAAFYAVGYPLSAAQLLPGTDVHPAAIG